MMSISECDEQVVPLRGFSAHITMLGAYENT